MHVMECIINLLERLAMRNELIDLELAGHVVVHQIRKLRAALNTAESAALPDTTRD